MNIQALIVLEISRNICLIHRTVETHLDCFIKNITWI